MVGSQHLPCKLIGTSGPRWEPTWSKVSWLIHESTGRKSFTVHNPLILSSPSAHVLATSRHRCVCSSCIDTKGGGGARSTSPRLSPSRYFTKCQPILSEIYKRREFHAWAWFAYGRSTEGSWLKWAGDSAALPWWCPWRESTEICTSKCQIVVDYHNM